ncbi:hypothetical protein JHK84_036791 [Glycine max]|nr:hypothetical protein JHK85_037112 [Glycine max]KAG5130394.1 hypothetical protein JHK84_036791 [Glycine max]
MGNCIVLQRNVVRVMKSDGKILEYKAPIRVHQVLNQFRGHAISESLPPVLHHLNPYTRLLKGQLYYLVPPPQASSKKVNKKRVRFAEPDEDDQVEDKGCVVRIKLVLSKQELKDMVQKGGISVNEVLSLVQGKGIVGGVDACRRDDEGFHGWKPARTLKVRRFGPNCGCQGSGSLVYKGPIDS